uniref:ANK_REP_REGION domain-containing protein n=1 Tax=Schistocephalus solidus TaxID=70667 RepID=A0A183T2R4_SCHSO
LIWSPSWSIAPTTQGKLQLHTNSHFCLKMGASLEATQTENLNAIHFACRRGDISVLKRLLEWQPEQTGRLLCAACKRGYTPIHLAAKFNHAEMTAILIQQRSPMELRDGTGCTPLLLAIKSCATATAITLIKLGADVHALDGASRNILHLAIVSGALLDEKLWEQLTKYTVVTYDMVSCLSVLSDSCLFKNTDCHIASAVISSIFIPIPPSPTPLCQKHGLFHLLVEEKDEFGCTALHYATKGCRPNLTMSLVDLGANCTAQNNERETPLHLAAHSGCLRTCESLLRTAHGLWAMNTPDARGRLPLHIAALNGHARLVRLLITKGSSFRRFGRPLFCTFFSFLPTKRCQKGGTPLHLAAKTGCLETCRVIHEANSQIIDVKDFRGVSLPLSTGCDDLHILPCLSSAENNQMRAETCRVIDRPSPNNLRDVDPFLLAVMISILVVDFWITASNHSAATGSSYDPLKCRGVLSDIPHLLGHQMTALHYAAKKNHSEVLEYLLQMGAKIEPDYNGIYFVTMALRKGNLKAAHVIAVSSR